MSKNQPAGKILKPDGTDVSGRDRSDDGTIIIRKKREPGHDYFFGRLPAMPWHKVDCPNCEGYGFVIIGGKVDGVVVMDDVICDVCNGNRKITVKKKREFENEKNGS
jgi:hypothetical protein